MRRATWRLDVTSAVPLPGRFEIAVDVIAPSTGPLRPLVLSALPGGFLSRRYFDLDREGEGAYSFAVAMARRGITTLAFDHVGTGELEARSDRGRLRTRRRSDRPGQPTGARARPRTARAGGSRDGPPCDRGSDDDRRRPLDGLLPDGRAAGARASPHRTRALLLLDGGAAGLPRSGPAQYLGDPARARREVGEIARRSMGTPYPAGPTRNESDRRAAFGVGTAPAERRRSCRRRRRTCSRSAGCSSMIPGGYAEPAQAIDVPVYVLVGDHDLHDERGIPDMLPRSPAVTTSTLEDCWHCHFVANTRETLWQRVGDWIARSPSMTAHARTTNPNAKASPIAASSPPTRIA
ncbi:MAG: hypothetical protein R3E53_05025 [Myxococcota bacterium]